MLKSLYVTTLLMLALVIPAPALSTVLFDFDDVTPTSKKSPGGPLVEVYMEGLYGSNVTVSQKTTAVRGTPLYGAAAGDLDNAYLKLGKGKGASAIVIHFDDDPIDSFSVDFKLFKKAKKFSILADGELISLDTLSKAQRKTGLSGQKTFFFDQPVHTLEFIGKKKSFAIDNLAVDLSTGDTENENTETDPLEESLPSESNNNEENNGNPIPQFIPLNDTGPVTVNQAAVPEPSSLLLLAFGFAAAALRAFIRKTAHTK